MNQIPSEIGLFRKMARLYTFNTPVRRGVYRIAMAALKIGGPLPDRLLATTDDGRRLVVDPGDEGYKFLYFTGQYEPAITSFISRAVLEGDVCIDLGANIGWYTTLLMRLAGTRGEVHAFEPMPDAFRLLEKNVMLNRWQHAVYLNQCAVGDRDGQVEMYLEAGAPAGHAAATGRGEHTEVARITTLDSYLQDNDVRDVAFVKADIEGSELAALRGASKLFEQKMPPVFMIEMALATSKRFGYSPLELISFLDGRADYSYFAIDEKAERLTRIEGFDENSPGANVLCVPANCGTERRRALGID